MSSDTSDSIQRRLGETTFIEPSGGILTEQLIQKLRNEKCSEDAVQPKTFQYPDDPPSTTSELEARISEAWDDLEERWDEVTRDNELFGMDVSEARRRWILKLFEGLGFDPEYQQANLSAGELEAKLSHFGWPRKESVTASHDTPDATPPVLHTIMPDGDHPLDDGDHRGAVGRQQSPHDELQRYLNATDDVQWSIVTDGLKFRVLRDYYHTYTRGYVEFDLENIFTNRNYDDFRALYRLCHASRFIPRGDGDDAEAPLESLYQVALATGVKVGEDLQSNVVEALETLGNGFLNQEIREALEEGGQEEAEAYYQDLLRIVYRLLFLLFAEQRGMMADRGDLYTKEYSISALRERAERKQSWDHQTDLWEGLKVTFRLVGQGVDEDDLHVPAYNGGLFDDEKLEFVQDAACDNEAILSAIHNLTHVEQQGYQQRISYADLGVDEIGAVYESLLEFTPQLADTAIELVDRNISSGSFYLDDRGMDRKETGSFYTDPDLVDELIQTALKPVVEDQVDDEAPTKVQEEQLLDITVCDPACGSGAFLIAANNHLGKELAKIRSDSPYPDERTIRQSRRSVVQHCIYGVDLNQMAVELAKVSLWINSAVEDKPLSFLDHHIKQGNSLIGTNEACLRSGIPYDAYEKSKGREFHLGNEVRKQMRKENRELSEESNVQAELGWSWEKEKSYVSLAERLDQISEEKRDDVYRKGELYRELRGSDDYRAEKLLYDVWTAAFFWDLEEHPDDYITPKTIERLRRNIPSDFAQADDPSDLEIVCKIATNVANQESFFHWELEFPTVFSGENPGFDCVLGNPPWEEVKNQPSEFFAVSAPQIANAPKNERDELIEELKHEQPQLFSKWKSEEQRVEKRRRFYNNSPTVAEGSVGKTNTYPLFTFLNSRITSPIGKSGFIVKTAIATDHDYSKLFKQLASEGYVDSLFDFENSHGYFPEVHRQERFCLLTLRGNSDENKTIELVFNLKTADDIEKIEIPELSLDELENLSSGSYQLPVLNSTTDLRLIKDISTDDAVEPLNKTESGWETFWGFPYDSGAVQADAIVREDIVDSENYEKLGIYEEHQGDDYFALYEGKYIDFYDHRRGSFEDVDKADRFGKTPALYRPTDEERNSSQYEIEPRYWVRADDVVEWFEERGWKNNWLLAYGRKGRTTDARTYKGTILPIVAVADTAPVLLPVGAKSEREAAIQSLALCGITNSYLFDYLVRTNITGSTIGKNLLNRMFVPSYDSDSEWLEELSSKVLQLTYTSQTLDPIANAVGNNEGPFKWDGESRQKLRWEINGLVAHLYNLNEDDVKYILNQFEIVRDKEKERYGNYRSQEKIIEHLKQYRGDKE